MSDAEIWQAVTAAIREETGATDATIEADTIADDVPGWDSLAHVRIMLNLEKRLNIRVKVAATYDAENVGQLVALLQGWRS